MRRIPHLLAGAGIAVSRDTMWRYLRREGLSFKKNLFATERARAAVARERARWQALKRHLDLDRLVFVDETWIKTNMAPLRGWAQRGQRLKGYTPHGHWRAMTFLAALRANGIGAPCIFDAPSAAAASRPGSSKSSSPRCGPATSSSSTISQATRARRSGRRSAAPVPASGSCRPTHPTSTPSSRPSPRSSTGCATRKNATSRSHGAISAISSTPSSQANAKITSETSVSVPSKTHTLKSIAHAS